MAQIITPQLYAVIYMPETTFLGFKMSKSRGREDKLRPKKAERRKKKKLGNMKTPINLWGVFLAIFYYKTGEKVKFLDNMYPPSGVSYIYIYTYIHTYIHTYIINMMLAEIRHNISTRM